MKYFVSKGFNVFGIDIVQKAINIAKQRIEKYKDNFICIKPAQNIQSLFCIKFDIIMANQSLYYLPNDQLNKTLNQINNMLSPKGVVFFTMMGIKNGYYAISKEMQNMNDLREVQLTGRLNETTYINFVKNEEDLCQRFNMFKPFFVGYYDCSCREGSGFHYQFIGTKFKFSE